MQTISLRHFTRDSLFRKNMVKKKEQMLLQSREKDGETFEFLVIPFSGHPSVFEKKKKRDFSEFIGAWGVEKNPLTIKQQKEEIRKAWLSCD